MAAAPAVLSPRAKAETLPEKGASCIAGGLIKKHFVDKISDSLTSSLIQSENGSLNKIRPPASEIQIAACNAKVDGLFVAAADAAASCC